MRTIASVRLVKIRPALILTRASELHLLASVTIAPITSTIRGLTSEVAVGPRNGLDHACVISCDNITTVRKEAVGDGLGLLFDDQEPSLHAPSAMPSTCTSISASVAAVPASCSAPARPLRCPAWTWATSSPPSWSGVLTAGPASDRPGPVAVAAHGSRQLPGSA